MIRGEPSARRVATRASPVASKRARTRSARSGCCASKSFHEVMAAVSHAIPDIACQGWAPTMRAVRAEPADGHAPAAPVERGAPPRPSWPPELEVSVRTIYRDVSALQAAGAPLWTETGPSGGHPPARGLANRPRRPHHRRGHGPVRGGPAVGGRAARARLGAGRGPGQGPGHAAARRPPGGPARPAPGSCSTRRAGSPVDEATDALPTVADAVWTDRRLDLTYRRGDRGRWRAASIRSASCSRPAPGTSWPVTGATCAPTGSAGSRQAAVLAEHVRATRRLRPGRARGPERRPRSTGRSCAIHDPPPSQPRRPSGSCQRRCRRSPRPRRSAAAGPPDHDGWREVELAVESDAVAHSPAPHPRRRGRGARTASPASRPRRHRIGDGPTQRPGSDPRPQPWASGKPGHR